MTATAFARLETRLNAAVMRNITNAEAAAFNEYGVQVQIPVIFDAPSILATIGAIGMSSSQPALLMASADVVTDPIGWALKVNGVDYTVVAHEPDGTGLSRLILERAA